MMCIEKRVNCMKFKLFCLLTELFLSTIMSGRFEYNNR